MSELDASTHAVFELGDMALAFGRVNRITYHQDGVTPESDTDHTVMLGLIGCAFAQRYMSHLNLSLIAQYALVHDLVEVLVGDTPTLRITPEEKKQKHQREMAAALQIARQYGSVLPWIPHMITQYETLKDKESRYIKGLDKVLPKITHILNGGVTLRAQQMTRQMLLNRYAQQLDELTELLIPASDFHMLFQLRRELITMLFDSIDSADGWYR